MVFGFGLRRGPAAAASDADDDALPPSSPLPFSDAPTVVVAGAAEAPGAAAGGSPGAAAAGAAVNGFGSSRSRSGSSISTLAGPSAVPASAAAADDKAEGANGRAAASMEEEVTMDRGGSGGSYHNQQDQHEKEKEQAPVAAGAKGEEESKEPGEGPDGGGDGKKAAATALPPDLGARPKSRSLPAVLRSSYRGDWRLLLKRLARRGAHGGGEHSDDDEDDEYGSLPKPPSIVSSLQTGVYSLQTSVHDFVHGVEEHFHRMPKWQYRLLVGSLIFLLCSLALLTVITVVYGFGMTYPHIALTKLELALPFPHLDRDGSIPVLATVQFNNPNAFPVRTRPAVVSVYTTDARTPDALLGETHVPGLELTAHEAEQHATADFRIKDVGHVKGGQAVVDAVLNGGHSFLYTQSHMDVVVKSLGFMPIHRTLQADCKILKVWGEADPNVLLSDCYGRFTRDRRRRLRGRSSAGEA